MTSSTQQRQWTGPALFSYGFRPFFLFGSLWAAVAMVVWIAMLAGQADLPTHLDPVSWHAHEFLFGYLSAIIAGFLLTAIPNWTGRLPVVGWSLAGLILLWGLGRLAIAVSGLLPTGIAAGVDLVFPVALAAVVLREIIAGKNWRNLIVLILLGVFTIANLLFHIEAATGEIAAQGMGLRLGTASVIMMISLIGGRIVPSFTRNWMVKAQQTDLPTPPMQRFDKATLGMSLAALGLWVGLPVSGYTGSVLLLFGCLHLVRLFRWRGYRTLSEPLLWVLHMGYLFVPLGALVESLAILRPDILAQGSAQHVWMAGAFGSMTLAVMARATLGHTGQDLRAGWGTTTMFLLVPGSVLARLGANLWPDMAMQLYAVAGLLWIGAFAGFALLYGPLLVRPKPSRV